MMYQGRTPRVLNTSLALIALAFAACNAASASGTGANSIFNYTNFSSSPSVHPTGTVAISGSQVHLTDGNSHNGGGLWYDTVQNIQSFTTSFTFQLPGIDGYGMFFVIQNSNSTTNPGFSGIGAGGNSANGMGYGGGGGASQPALGNSIGIKFDATPFNQSSWFVAPSPLSSTGLYVDGGPAIGVNGPNSGFGPEVDLHHLNISVGSNDVMQAVITYDGSILTMVLTDTSTGATTRLSWPVNIPAIVGANTAYIGFCGSTPVSSSSATVTKVLSWAFSEGYNTRLATPSFSVTPGQYTSTQSVSMSGPAGATIYYTTNGMPPTTASTKYTGSPISVSSNELIQAVAVEAGSTDSYVAQGNYQIQASSTPVINFPSGFASANGLIQPVGYATINSGNIVLTDTKNVFEAAAAWYAAPVNIQTFNTTFTLNPTTVTANGMAFVLQNYPQTTTGTNNNWTLGNGPFGTDVVSGGPWTLSGTSTNLGYTGIRNSIGVIFDYLNGSGDLTGLYTNGAVPTGSSIDMTSSGVSLHSGHPLSVNLSYNGTTLVETVTDTVTSAHFTRSYTVDIPSIVGASTAYAGFTASTEYFGANQTVSAWTYSASQGQTPALVPAAPTNLVVR
jgi:hypothetical protein